MTKKQRREAREANKIARGMERIIIQAIEAKRPDWQKRLDSAPLRVQPLYMSQRDYANLMADLKEWQAQDDKEKPM